MARLFGPILGFCLVCAVPANAQDGQSAAPQPPKWGAAIDFEGKAGTQRHLGEADVLVPIWQDEATLLFANVRGRVDDSNSKEGNYGLALRHMQGDWNFGAYGYFDRRQTETENFFNQATIGVEALSTDWDMRANLYAPLGDRTKSLPGSTGSSGGASTASLVGTTVTVTTPGTLQSEEKSLAGFDSEIGWRVPVFAFESPYDFRVYGGGFHFYDPDDQVANVTGPRLRAEFTAYEAPYLFQGSRVTLGAEWQDDGIRGSQGFGSLRLRIPLQSEEQRNRQLTAQERRMTTPIVRDIDIVAQTRTTGTQTVTETATQTSGGSTITVLTTDTNGNGSLTNEFTTAGANSTVIISGTINTTTGSTLQSGQTVTGSGTLTVRTPSGKTASLALSGGTVSSTATAGGVFTMAANSTLNGLTITQTPGVNNSGVGVVSNVAGVTISNLTFTQTTSGTGNSTGISLGGGSATISNNSLTTSSGADSYVLFLENGTATVTGNTLTATGGGTVVHTHIQNMTLTSSTGNTLGGTNTGTCENGGGNTGSVSFTNAATCP